MTGAFLIGFLILGIIFLIIDFLQERRYTDAWRAIGITLISISFIYIVAIPISRIDSKVNAEYFKTLQTTIDYNRLNEQDLNVLERTAIITEINSCNRKITHWKVRGKKWYNNKWYYHPLTQSVELIK